MKITLGFSPCPNDTFIFDAMVNGKIDTEGLSFDLVMEDVQTLNEMAIAGKIDVTKISYGTLPLVQDNYVVLNSGSALGKGVGPLLISSFPVPAPATSQCLVAIPGKYTTAHVLFSLAYPEAHNKVFLRYDEIEEFVLKNKGTLENIQSVHLGVIIHENRFTYQDKGLVKQTDLGAFWEEETGYPVPLGGIVARREMDIELTRKIDRLVKKSLQYSYAQGSVLSDFVKNNALEMEESVMKQHIELYVNDFSLSLGKKGKEAVMKFISVHSAINKIEMTQKPLFIS
ncbi:MAG: 1,4-dihydroxy-6-naphthoate synthase [Flavitalea sp.]